MFELSPERLRKFLEMMRGETDEDYEPIATLSPEQRREWDEVQALEEKAKSMYAEAQARRSLFWVRLEQSMREAGLSSDDLKVDDGVVYKKVEEKKDVPDDLPNLGAPE